MPRVTITCETCGRTVIRKRDVKQIAKGSPRFCSQACAAIARRGSGNPMWTGGRSLKETGYVVIWKNGRRDFEHRFVMEDKLGRRLRTDEHVHHINHIRDDNRPENLEILGASEHGHHHKGYRRYETRPCLICGTPVTRRAKQFRGPHALCDKPECKGAHGGQNSKAARDARTTCAQGHAFTSENTSIARSGQRTCKACGRESTRRYRAKQKT